MHHRLTISRQGVGYGYASTIDVATLKERKDVCEIARLLLLLDPSISQVVISEQQVSTGEWKDIPEEIPEEPKLRDNSTPVTLG